MKKKGVISFAVRLIDQVFLATHADTNCMVDGAQCRGYVAAFARDWFIVSAWSCLPQVMES